VGSGGKPMKIRFAIAVAALLGGCASKSSAITAAYVSPIPY
jgi:type IV pilus biogenesis protein CpaD/CtpE